ncbi:MAG: hypothetical protein JW797_07725 [Bradymonadales bacterium]|nr:hypothetical protein [Bradymonadales bacterium]
MALPVVLALLISWPASGETIARSLLVGEEALVQCAEGALFVEEIADSRSSPATHPCPLGELRRGLVQLSTSRSATLSAGTHQLTLQPGVYQVRLGASGLTLCTREGEAALARGLAVPAGACLAFDTAGRTDGLQTATEDGGAPPLWVPLDPPAPPHPPLFERDPAVALERLDQTVRQRQESGQSDSEQVEAGGAAACLEGGDGGGEAGGPEGPETPETEIDRTQHRVELDVTLEGF